MNGKKIGSYLEEHLLEQKVDIQTAYGSKTNPDQIRFSFCGAWKISAKEAAAAALLLTGALSVRAVRRLFF